ncbi:MAG: serine protease [Cyanosarcina radialis HA8281-LM2]|jgi:tetratricopeptide (TPR) repeat protein|nr:serine protease [Cyanosarcina radialis HA8281-LM2]
MLFDRSRSYLIPPCLVGTAAVVAISIYPSASLAAKSPQEIAEAANLVTVQVNASIPGNGYGSGVIIAKEGKTYTVLTANHVKRDVGENPRIRTHDGKSHPITGFQSLGSLDNEKDPDLAILTFTSDSDYQTATLGDSGQVAIGAQIFVFGYPVQGGKNSPQAAAERNAEFSPGYVTSYRKNAPYGYTLRYNAVTLAGMSGAPVFDVDGRLVGLHGLGEQDRSAIQTESGEGVSIRIKTGFNSAIPISTFLAKRSQVREAVANVTVNTAPSTDNPDQRLSRPESARDYFVTAIVQTDRGERLAAINSLNESINRDPNSPEAYYYRGNARHSKGDDRGAIEDYTQAIKLKPNYSDAYYNRGWVRYTMKEYQAAVEDFTQVLRIDPNNAEVYYNRAAARSKLKDREGTVADFTQAIRAEPNYISAYIERGRFRNSLGDRKGAIDDFTKAIELTPNTSINHAVALYNRGMVRRNIKQLPAALADLQQAADLFQKQGRTTFYEKAADEVYWLNREINRGQNPPTNRPNSSTPQGRSN